MSQSIEPMAAGEKPTEPGWYVIQREYGGRDFVRAWRYHHLAEGVSEYVVGSTGEELQADEIDRENWTFIARIYPDRIEGRKG
jgi:hypothetical protein